MQTVKTARKLQNIFALFLPEIRELLEEKNFSALKDLLKRIHSMDLAEGWPLLSDQVSEPKRHSPAGADTLVIVTS